MAVICLLINIELINIQLLWKALTLVINIKLINIQLLWKALTLEPCEGFSWGFF